MLKRILSLLAFSVVGFTIGYLGSEALFNATLERQRSIMELTYPSAEASPSVVAPSSEGSVTLPSSLKQYPIRTIDLKDAAVVTITGQIDQEVGAIADKITLLSKTNKEIYVLIDSPGGSVMDGAKVVGAIQASKAHVTTICLAECLSMGFIIFEYGNTRLMTPNALLMAHPAAGGVRGTLGQMQARLNMVTTYVSRMDAYIANRAGLSTQAFHDKSVSELWLDAYAAVNEKFADGIAVVDGKKEEVIQFKFLKHSEPKFNLISE